MEGSRDNSQILIIFFKDRQAKHHTLKVFHCKARLAGGKKVGLYNFPTKLADVSLNPKCIVNICDKPVVRNVTFTNDSNVFFYSSLKQTMGSRSQTAESHYFYLFFSYDFLLRRSHASFDFSLR